MASNNKVAKIDHQLLPLPEDAAKLYEEAGGALTHFSSFGEDPFRDNNVLQEERLMAFHARHPSFQPIFHKLVNNDDSLFIDALDHFIFLSTTLNNK